MGEIHNGVCLCGFTTCEFIFTFFFRSWFHTMIALWLSRARCRNPLPAVVKINNGGNNMQTGVGSLYFHARKVLGSIRWRKNVWSCAVLDWDSVCASCIRKIWKTSQNNLLLFAYSNKMLFSMEFFTQLYMCFDLSIFQLLSEMFVHRRSVVLVFVSCLLSEKFTTSIYKLTWKLALQTTLADEGLSFEIVNKMEEKKMRKNSQSDIKGKRIYLYSNID